MLRYSAVLLDVDGTLVDSNDAHTHSWVETFAEHGLDVPYSRIAAMIGMGGDRIIEVVAGLPRDTRANARLGEQRSENFRERWLSRVRPFPGVRDFVQRLHRTGYRLALATAARAEELGPLLALADLTDVIEAAASSSDVESSKPAPDIVEAALAAAPGEHNRARTVLVGDTVYDALAARHAGIDFLHITEAPRALLEVDP